MEAQLGVLLLMVISAHLFVRVFDEASFLLLLPCASKTLFSREGEKTGIKYHEQRKEELRVIREETHGLTGRDTYEQRDSQASGSLLAVVLQPKSTQQRPSQSFR